MIELEGALPAPALCDAHPQAVADDLDGHWWHASPETLTLDPQTRSVMAWRDSLSGAEAHPTQPNRTGTPLGQVDAWIGLQCRSGKHCGYHVDNATQTAQTTIAIRFYIPPGTEARTLLTLNTGDNYLFLSHSDGAVSAKDNKAQTALSLPSAQSDRDAPQLAIVSLDGPATALGLDDALIHTQTRRAALSGHASLFIGCRNQRPGLLKTLGAALILDVWLLPGRALLQSPQPADRRALTAIRRHHLWAESP